ncbi:MAG: rhodanese-like domain-containing protein [Yoonia sp.]
MTTRVRIGTATVLAAIVATSSGAQEVQITDGQMVASFTINDTEFNIARVQDNTATLTGEFAQTSRPCPDFCIQPMVPAAGVTPVGELEVIQFLQDDVANNTGLLINARLPDGFAKGALPGAVNVPFAALNADNPYQAEILQALGAKTSETGLDFANARALLVYGNGPWDAQSSRAVRSLIDAGYPANLIQNYRGGLEDWLHLGLFTVLP